jgi:hypothetical protein
MTKKHYIAIATIIAHNDTSHDIIHALADFFEEDNKLFQRKKFLQSCEKKSTTPTSQELI